MSLEDIPENPMPTWVKLVIIACCLPVLAFPWLLNLCPDDSPAETFLWIYPFYVALAGVCAWRSWARRKELTWVVLAVLLLTHAAMWMLVDPTILLP